CGHAEQCAPCLTDGVLPPLLLEQCDVGRVPPAPAGDLVPVLDEPVELEERAPLVPADVRVEGAQPGAHGYLGARPREPGAQQHVAGPGLPRRLRPGVRELDDEPGTAPVAPVRPGRYR